MGSLWGLVERGLVAVLLLLARALCLCLLLCLCLCLGLFRLNLLRGFWNVEEEEEEEEAEAEAEAEEEEEEELGVKGESDMAFATSSGLGDGGGVSPVPLIGRCTDREGVCTVPYPCCWCMVLGGDINVPSCTVGMLEAANRASSSRIRSSMWVSVTAVVPGDGGWGKTLPLLVSLSLRMRGVGRRRCSLVSPEGRDFSLGVRLVGNALVVSCLVSCLVSGEGKLGLALFVGEWMPLGLGWAAARCFMSKMSKNNRAWVLWGGVMWLVQLYPFYFMEDEDCEG